MEKLELLMVIHVKTEDAISLDYERGDKVVMIPFSGYVTGPLFQGEILKGAVDTQMISADGKKHTLSARYMISGKDYLGHSCMLFIENNGNIYEPNNDYLFRTYPRIITSSDSLKFIEQEILVAEGIVDSEAEQIHISIYKVC